MKTQPSLEAASIANALQQSQNVQKKVHGCAKDLKRTNALLKRKLTIGTTLVATRAVLTDSKNVERKVRECKDGLQEVAETLTQGLEDLGHTETTLADLQTALTETQAALVAATNAESIARHKALHDGLTGLPNRELLLDRLTQAIAVAGRHGLSLAVMFIDLNHFKAINDAHSHAAGDMVLHAVAMRLIARCREEDTVSRFGGDEFLILLTHPKGRGNVERIAKSLLQCIALPIESGSKHVGVEGSIGISIYPDDGLFCEELIHLADKAMYQAKQQKLGYRFFSLPTPA